VLVHFSARYSRAEITEAVLREAKACGVTFPVHVVFPGETCLDILRELPVWPPIPTQNQ
jgi:hypothetical protein